MGWNTKKNSSSLIFKTTITIKVIRVKQLKFIYFILEISDLSTNSFSFIFVLSVSPLNLL